MKDNMKKALIVGITGQDGSYLTELLLSKGYEVHGIRRRASSFNTSRIDHLLKDWHNDSSRLFLHHGDLTDTAILIQLIRQIAPDEIYNLGAMSHVQISFEMPVHTGDIDALGTMRLLEAIKILGLEKKIRFYQASTSELYGKVQEVPQTEKTPFYPRSPYAVAKLYSFWAVINYREAYDLYAVNGILFNHESPRRGETFVTRKITRGLSRIVSGIEEVLHLGNLESKRDWGHAKDYVEGMWLMLQQETPQDYVLATGKTYSIRDFLSFCLDYLGIVVKNIGSGVDEKLIVLDAPKYKHLEGKVIVKIDPLYYRPTEVELLIGDPSKAQNDLGWTAKTDLKMMIEEMMDNDLKDAFNG
jgi:GDPmannose 4,6-dehydratase